MICFLEVNLFVHLQVLKVRVHKSKGSLGKMLDYPAWVWLKESQFFLVTS